MLYSRTGWALLAVSALVASLFAVGASPAAAITEDSKPNEPAPFKACVGDALDDQGFTDLGSLEATVPNINCLAYYGITIGKTADTFDPNSNVTRSEMALFLYRAASLMGVDLMGGDMMVDYGDIAELGEDRQNAITALARNGILSGRGSMAFEPGADITRAEMAVALVALLDHTPGAPVSKNTDGMYVVGDETDVDSYDYFADARRTAPRATDNAISAAYELGITSGVGDGTMFDPSGTIPRRDMATFIIRALNHSSVRPAGATAQLSEGKVVVSVRDTDFAPVVNASVDIFQAAASAASKAFKADGTCSSRVTAVQGNDSCKIDAGDPTTLTNGDVESVNLTVGDGLTVWVWTGDIDDEVGAATNHYELDVPKGVGPAPAASSIKVSNDRAQGATQSHFGDTITVTLQLQGDPDSDTATDNNVNVGPPEGDPTTVGLRVETRPGTATTGDAEDVKSSTLTFGADGSVSFTITADDPSATADDNEITVQYVIDNTANTGITLAAADGTVSFLFSEDAAVATNLALSAGGPKDAPGASGKASNTATVTVTDQYGKPFGGASVTLSSNTTGSAINPAAGHRTLITGRTSGTFSISYTYTGGAAVEALTANYNPPNDGDPDITDVTTQVHWVGQIVGTAGTPSTQGTPQTVANADLEANRIVILDSDDSSLPKALNYDSGDVFYVDNEPVTMATFEEKLGAGVEARLMALAAGDTPGTLTLTWASYISDDPSDIAEFKLVTS